MSKTDRDEKRASGLAAAFRQARARTDAIFALVHEEAYYERPIPLRHPIAFYDGHLDAFIHNTLFQNVLGEGPLHPAFDDLFRRGIDPRDEAAARLRRIESWPSRAEVREYKDLVTARLHRALADPGLFRRHDVLRDGKLLYLLLEHELMHQETLLYMLHRLPYQQKVPPADRRDGPGPQAGPAPVPYQVEVPAGIAVLGSYPGEFDYGWDNEFPQVEVRVPAFRIDAFDVTNGQFLEFVAAAGYHRPEFWDAASFRWVRQRGVEHPPFWVRRGTTYALCGLFAEGPLPLSAPVCVTHAEASAYARFAGKALPTEAQWHRAAYGDHPDWPYPWGHAPPTPERGNFDFASDGPVPVGSFPLGRSPCGAHDLVGNGWEWTASVFAPFPGFAPLPAYPGYSADFFDGHHYVLKGGSWATAARLLRRPLRNWFYWDYPYMYATFRCVCGGNA